MMFMMFLFWGVVIFGIIYAIRFFGGGYGYRYENRNRALEILQERYARGEINKDEYEEKKRLLAS